MRTLTRSANVAIFNLHYSDSKDYSLKAIDLALRLDDLRLEVEARYSVVTALTTIGVLEPVPNRTPTSWLKRSGWMNAIGWT